jgi:hypothetical protein
MPEARGENGKETLSRVPIRSLPRACDATRFNFPASARMAEAGGENGNETDAIVSAAAPKGRFDLGQGNALGKSTRLVSRRNC